MLPYAISLCALTSTFTFAFTPNVPVCAREISAPFLFLLSFLRIAATFALLDALLTVAVTLMSFKADVLASFKSFAENVQLMLLSPVFSFLPFAIRETPFVFAFVRFAIVILSVAF